MPGLISRSSEIWPLQKMFKDLPDRKILIIARNLPESPSIETVCRKLAIPHIDKRFWDIYNDITRHDFIEWRTDSVSKWQGIRCEPTSTKSIILVTQEDFSIEVIKWSSLVIKVDSCRLYSLVKIVYCKSNLVLIDVLQFFFSLRQVNNNE